MSRKSALAVLVACWAAWPASAWAASETDCAAQWKSADGNNDGVLVGPEADRYLAYYRVRAHVTPVDGRITQQEFMKSCQSDIFMAKARRARRADQGRQQLHRRTGQGSRRRCRIHQRVVARQGR